MQCSRPVKIPLVNARKQWGGEDSFAVPCGRCRACRIARAREWATRVVHEVAYHQESSFVTLTYSPEHLPATGEISKRELQLFFKRLRERLPGRRFKYYAAGEYGEKNLRPHYHVIFFGVGLGEEDRNAVKDAWGKGDRSPLPGYPDGVGYDFGTVTYDSARYTADYVQKKNEVASRNNPLYGKQPPFQLTSLGLGKAYAKEHAQQILDNLGITIRGTEVGIPRYYVKKLEIPQEIRQEMAEIKRLEKEAQLLKKASGRMELAAEIAGAERLQHDKNLRARAKLKRAKDLKSTAATAAVPASAARESITKSVPKIDRGELVKAQLRRKNRLTDKE